VDANGHLTISILGKNSYENNYISSFVSSSFISFTTVGFGDKIPFIGSNLRLIAMTCYLAWGIVLMSTLIAVISHYLRRIHYLGRRFKGTKDVNVWFGGQQMSVSDLLRVVADKFKVQW
jgi:hypothetical protein